MTTSEAIVSGIWKGLKGFPRKEASEAALEVAARYWVERGLREEDFLEKAGDLYRSAAGLVQQDPR